jgi:translation initiation factor IF-2
MAKVRVYELAKELDLESKDLVEKLVAGGMDIKNYMSTLDEAAVVKAKEIVSGVVKEVIEERRIKSTVIRRRKRTIKMEPEPPVSKPEEEAEVIAEEEGTPVEKIKEAEMPAEIEEPAMEPRVPEKEAAIEAKAPPAEEISEEEPVKEAVKPKAPAREAPKPAPKVKPKKAKKKKIDEPAKIIRRPEEGPLSDVLAKAADKAVAKPVPKEPTPLRPVTVPEETPEEAPKLRPKRKKKEKKKDESPEVVPKGAIRRRKKEIYEKADLYQGRPPKRKGRKGSGRDREAGRTLRHTEITVPKAIKRRLKVQDSVTVAELARAMGIKGVDLIKRLMQMGYAAYVNKPLDFETASVLADEFGYELELDTFEEGMFVEEAEDRPEDLEPRPPVVTIMGHVDHGKTSLLDFIRKSNIIGEESGGITQHIGAYYVERKEGDVVFLDTPGHEAFTAMRARGAKVTDIIVLVVAADDGVMPQTREAIDHARAANIPVVVAVNKIDKPEAQPEKVRRELAELGLAPEQWGGDTIFGDISAKTGEGVDELLNLILLQSEMLELKGNPRRQARGTIIEAKLDKSKGPVATVLIKNGTLRKGDYFICGEHYGRVRAMHNQLGKPIKSAAPSVPVEIYGISGVPMAGDEFAVVQDEKTSKQVIEHRRSLRKQKESAKRGLVSLEDLFERIKEGGIKELNIVIKADVQGSQEALSESLEKQSTDEVKLKIIHSGTGAISESDVMLASASGAIIIGFNVRANPRVREIAEKENVDIRFYDVIYNVIQDVRLAMTGLLEPIYEERVMGRAEVKEIFRVPKIGAIAGCQVTDGRVVRNAKVRLLRDDVVVFDGKIASLRRFKEDAREVLSGYECGIGLENFQDIKPGDVFEVYELEERKAEL